MTSKEREVYRKLIVEAVMEGVTRALHTVRITTYTQSPASAGHSVQDTTYQVFEDLWPETIGTKPDNQVQVNGVLRHPASSPEPPSCYTVTTNNIT
jgi:hypothetical protein